MVSSRTIWILSTIIIVLLAGLAQGATIYVPDNYGTIQDAINAATAGDTIIVRPGTYHENIDFIGKAIRLESEKGFNATTIDGGQKGSVVTLATSEPAGTVLKGFTITNGSGTVHIVGNTCGGGIFCSRAAPTIEDNFITLNRADSQGGGIYCEFFASRIANNRITQNVVSGGLTAMGGGIYCANSTGTIEGNMIKDNLVAGLHMGEGGGIGWQCLSSNIINNDVQDNYVFGGIWAHGGGILGCGGDHTVAGNVVANNITYGLSFSYGAGCYLFGNQLVVTNNTIMNNIAEGCDHYCYGGGIYADGSTTITNTILRDNKSLDSPELSLSGGTVTYCNVKGGWPGTGNIDVESVFLSFRVSPYHLAWTCPCRDAGNNSAQGIPDKDIDGDPRITAGRVDIGANEYNYYLEYAMPGTGSWAVVQGVGYPSAPVTLMLSSGVQDPPLTTPYGDLHLALPLLWQGLIGSVKADGSFDWRYSIPSGWQSGSEHPMQALIGPIGGAYTRLTNHVVLVAD